MVTSRSIRAHFFPLKGIAYYLKSGTVPSEITNCYTLESTYFDKFTKNVACVACNPGSCIGVDTHTETTPGTCHSHTVGCASHLHVANVGNASATATVDDAGPVTAAPNHTHPGKCTAANAPCLGTTTTTDNHVHGSGINNEPTFNTVRYIKKTNTSLSIRSKNLPKDVVLAWDCILANIPCNWSQNTDLFDDYIKNVPNGSCPPLTAGGTNTHGHTSCAQTHTHSVNASCHGHTISGNMAATNSAAIDSGGFCPPVNRPTVPRAHIHSVNTLAICTNTICPTGNPNGSHEHGTASHLPQSYEVAFITHSTIGMRRLDVPRNAILEWQEPVACIPAGYQIPDGVGDTNDIRARYLKGTGCGEAPGSTAGTTTHQHSNAVAHQHGIPSHTHSMTGQTSTFVETSGHNQSAGPLAAKAHFHVPGSAVAAGAICTNTSACHTHTATSNDPASKETALLQRV